MRPGQSESGRPGLGNGNHHYGRNLTESGPAGPGVAAGGGQRPSLRARGPAQQYRAVASILLKPGRLSSSIVIMASPAQAAEIRV